MLSNIILYSIETYKIHSCTSAANDRHSLRKVAKGGCLGLQECLWNRDHPERMFLALPWLTSQFLLPSKWFSYIVLSPRLLYHMSRRLPLRIIMLLKRDIKSEYQLYRFFNSYYFTICIYMTIIFNKKDIQCWRNKINKVEKQIIETKTITTMKSVK